MKRFAAHLLAGLCIILSAASCTDDLIFDYPDLSGESTVTFSIKYHDYTPALDETRAAGNAIKSIETLWVVIYKEDGAYYDKLKISDFTVKDIRDNVRPDGSTAAEAKTGHVEFTVQIPNGRYKMYAVANCDLTNADVSTEDGLRSIQLTWDNSNIANNREMFGFFAPKNDATSATGFNAPVITISRTTAELHAWVRRAASKLTIAFDTKGLKDNTYIYIKSIAIKDIPKNCWLGKDNTPNSTDALHTTGETFYFAGAKASHTDAKANYTDWRLLTNGTQIWGYQSEKTAYTDGDRLAHEHSETAPALYFYENMQGEGEVGTVTDKRQDVSGNNNQVSYPDGIDPTNEAWKDAMPNGTYIEVEGYYICEDVKRLGRGPIKYRFMLGKDIIKDYNAERNYHYKLTLMFNGYANDIDWHIEYDEEETPGFFTPDTTYVSYLYNQPANVPIRATPKIGYKLEKIEAVIVDNEWRPYDDGNGVASYNTLAWSMQKNGTEYYSGGQAKANTLDAECAPNCEFGFLSLRNDTRVNIEMGGTATGLTNATFLTNLITNFRNDYYKVYSSNPYCTNGKRVYTGFPQTETGADGILGGTTSLGQYTMYLSENGGYKNYAMEVPLFTRAKSLDSWAVYSGVNAFYQNHRYARIKFTAYYVNENNASDTYNETSYTHVLQARRVENPAGIYRKYNSTSSFQVNLKYSVLDANGNVASFNPIVSHGPWSATIESDPSGIVKLTTSNGQTATKVGEKITGLTGTQIDFTYTPNKTLTSSQTAGAVISVRYHNHSCVHKIVVRQGYAPITLVSGGPKWLSYNVYGRNALTASPLSVGSLFCHNANLNYAVAESNNTRTRFGVGQAPYNYDNYQIIDAANAITSSNSTEWPDFSQAVDVYTPSSLFRYFTIGGTNYRLPTLAEVNAVLNNMDFHFGIVYGDGAVETLSDANAYKFTDYTNAGTASQYGVRGTVIYNSTNGNNIFLPYGATGHARRKGFDNSGTSGSSFSQVRAYGILRYGSMDVRLGGNDGWYHAKNNYRPMAYDLPTQFGALYWLYNGSYDDTTDKIALDMNYGNFMTGTLPASDAIGGTYGSDAFPIRPVVR